MRQANRGRPPRLWRWLERVGKLLVILVPGLYLLSRTYEHVYWRALGLDSALLDRSVESQLYLGYEVIWYTLSHGLTRYATLGIPHALMPTAGLLIGAGAVVAAVAAVRLRRQRWVHRKRAHLRMLGRRLRRWVRSGRWMRPGEFTRVDRIVTSLDRGASGLLLLTCALATLLLAPHWGSWAGARMAERTDQRFRLWAAPERQQRNFTLVHLKDAPAGSSTQAMLLECGSRWCVYFDGNDFVAVAPEQIARLQGCLRIEAMSAGGLGCNHKALPAPR